MFGSLKVMDIFDKLMEFPLLKLFQRQYTKYKEPILYLLFGGVTTFISIFTFGIFSLVFDVNELTSNVFSWILSVAFAYVSNKIWVFDVKTQNYAELLRQIVSFFSSRLITLGVEELMMIIFVIWLGLDSMIIKIVAQIVIIVLNYFVSKLWIFKKN